MVRRHPHVHRHPHGGHPKHPGAHPPDKTAGYGITPAKAQSTKEFNKDLLYVQGFPSQVNAGSTVPTPINLNAPGRWLHGIAVIPVTGSDLTNVKINLVVNNNNVVINAAAPNLDPGYTQGQLFFPTPQPLSGNDTITLNATNSSGAAVSFNTNFFYVPQKQ
jgi:hypothetical protein